jgi:tetratricopeptide (TPR) repeat protein
MASAPSAQRPALSWIEDDYARALAEGHASGRAIVAVAGAAWCAPCRELRDDVLADASLAPLATKYVWLAIDVERDANAAFVARFASDALPAVIVIDGTANAVAWRGSVTPALVARVVQAASDAIARRAPIALDPELATLARVSSLATTDAAACADAATQATSLPPEIAAAVVAMGLACVPDSPALLERARRLVAEPAILASDRSALYEHLVAAPGDARTSDARAWLAFLDAESHRAPSPAARSALDRARLSANLALGRPADALPALARTERDLPKDFVAPALLARALAASARWDDAIRAIDRALARAYGPYRVVLLARKVDVLVGSGDAAAALRTLDDALVLARSLPLTGGYARLRATLEVRRAALAPKASSPGSVLAPKASSPGQWRAR